MAMKKRTKKIVNPPLLGLEDGLFSAGFMPEITQSQKRDALVFHGFLDGSDTTDDAFGASVEKYQTFHGLVPDAIAGPVTTASLIEPRMCGLPDLSPSIDEAENEAGVRVNATKPFPKSCAGSIVVRSEIRAPDTLRGIHNLIHQGRIVRYPGRSQVVRAWS